MGGGVDVVSDGAVPPSTVLQTSFGTGDDGSLTQWAAALLNPSGNPVDVAIQAICAEEPAEYAADSDNDTIVDAGTSDDAELSCPDGLVVLGGGDGIRSDTVMDTQSFLEESLPVQDDNGDWTGWRVRAHNNSANPQPLTVQVVCGEEPDDYAVVADQQTIPGVGQSAGPGQQPVRASPSALSGGAGVTEEIPRDPNAQTVLRDPTPPPRPTGPERSSGSPTSASPPHRPIRNHLRDLREPAPLTNAIAGLGHRESAVRAASARRWSYATNAVTWVRMESALANGCAEAASIGLPTSAASSRTEPLIGIRSSCPTSARAAAPASRRRDGADHFQLG